MAEDLSWTENENTIPGGSMASNTYELGIDYNHPLFFSPGDYVCFNSSSSIENEKSSNFSLILFQYLQVLVVSKDNKKIKYIKPASLFAGTK